MDALVHNLLEPLRHLRIHLVFLEQFERRSVHDQLDIDVVRPALSFNVLVDQRKRVLGDIGVLAVHMVEYLHFLMAICRLGPRRAERKRDQ